MPNHLSSDQQHAGVFVWSTTSSAKQCSCAFLPLKSRLEVLWYCSYSLGSSLAETILSIWSGLSALHALLSDYEKSSSANVHVTSVAFLSAQIDLPSTTNKLDSVMLTWSLDQQATVLSLTSNSHTGNPLQHVSAVSYKPTVRLLTQLGLAVP